MSLAARWVRLLMVVSAAGFAGAAYAIRAVGDGLIEQYSGAAFSGAHRLHDRALRTPTDLSIAGRWRRGRVLLVHRVRTAHPLPGEFSQRNWFARQLLGAQFDLIDVA
ncbi:hypothetical protein BKA00_004221 [Actinomadura coerulea]|uniref:Uncharacterized protein n=1 Tax=Actinomadura coerulea TaxID=46159 RepID=A0A7X0L0B5_9ACTN|nr:hypothetical protein [Actinomadura coerulea]MBB6397307.1 hypothetical protein [Actinomadura coerulea]GGQ01774.1 hypothetical protein GCM10010187_16730 [Actinomadura coerulea]